MSYNKDDFFRWVVSALLSLIAFFGLQIRLDQSDFSCRLRVLELQNARMMERLGIQETAKIVDLPP